MWSSALTSTRIWVQEHGEQAFVLGLLAGVVVVLAFPLVAFLFALALLFGALVWFLAEPGDGEHTSRFTAEPGASTSNGAPYTASSHSAASDLAESSTAESNSKVNEPISPEGDFLSSTGKEEGEEKPH